MKLRLNDRIKARDLRKQGLSFNEIMGQIPNLSKGTLNYWLKDIELTQKQKDRLLIKIKNGADKGRMKGAFANHQKRIHTTKSIMDQAKGEVKIRMTNSLFSNGIMLYWAEGEKSTSLERVGIVNSDPIMIKLMMMWFRNICGVQEEKFRAALQITDLHNKKETEQFWSEVTRIPLTQFHKTIVKQTPLKGRRNPSYVGTCSVIISDKNLFRKIMGWKLGILENLQLMPL